MLNHIINNQLANIILVISATYLFCLHPVQPCIAQKKVDLEEHIKPDSALKTGQLSNGFTYFLLPQKDESEIALHFVVKAGTAYELRDQYELAHVLEHLAYDDSPGFGDVMQYFTNRGLERGTDINAGTGNMETHYYLKIPADSTRLINDGLRFLRNCASNINLDSANIEKERKIVAEEYRRASSETDEMDKTTYASIVGDEESVRHIVANKMKSIGGFKHAALLKFYKTWYRPDRQAIIIVGKFDAKKIETVIKKLFSDYFNPVFSSEKSMFSDVLDSLEKYVASYISAENVAQVNIYNKRNYWPRRTIGDLQSSIIGELYDELMASRLEKFNNNLDDRIISQNRDCHQIIGPPLRYLHTAIYCRPDSLKQMFKFAASELLRVKRYGFTESEFSLVKSKFNKRKIFPRGVLNMAFDIQDFFVNGIVFQNDKDKHRLTQHLINHLTLQALNDTVKQWLTYPYNIVLFVPENFKSILPTKTEIYAWLNDLKTQQMPEYIRGTEKEELLDNKFVQDLQHNNFNKKIINESGVTAYVFPNNIIVYCKALTSSTGVHRKVSITYYVPRGFSHYDSSNLDVAKVVGWLVQSGGLGKLNNRELTAYLKSKSIGFNQSVTDIGARISVTSDSLMLERALQVLYVSLMVVRKDSLEFEKLKESIRYETPIKNGEVGVFRSRLLQRISGEENASIKYEAIQNIKVDKVLEVYHDMYLCSENPFITMVGQFDIRQAERLIKKYIGSIGTVCHGLAKNEMNAASIKDTVLFIGKNPDKAEVVIEVPLLRTKDSMASLKTRVIDIALNQVLISRLRTKEAGVYGIGVVINRNKKEDTYIISISFSCSPDRFRSLINAAIEEIKFLRSGKYSDVILDAARLWRESTFKEITSNFFWEKYLEETVKSGNRIEKIYIDIAASRKLTAADIESFLYLYMPVENIKTYTVLPASFKPAL